MREDRLLQHHSPVVAHIRVASSGALVGYVRQTHHIISWQHNRFPVRIFSSSVRLRQHPRSIQWTTQLLHGRVTTRLTARSSPGSQSISIAVSPTYCHTRCQHAAPYYRPKLTIELGSRSTASSSYIPRMCSFAASSSYIPCSSSTGSPF